MSAVKMTPAIRAWCKTLAQPGSYLRQPQMSHTGPYTARGPSGLLSINYVMADKLEQMGLITWEPMSVEESDPHGLGHRTKRAVLTKLGHKYALPPAVTVSAKVRNEAGSMDIKGTLLGCWPDMLMMEYDKGRRERMLRDAIAVHNLMDGSESEKLTDAISLLRDYANNPVTRGAFTSQFWESLGQVLAIMPVVAEAPAKETAQ